MKAPRVDTLTMLELGGEALFVAGVGMLAGVGWALLAAGLGFWGMRVAADRVSTRPQRWARKS